MCSNWQYILREYQLLPYQRTAEIFKDLFGHALSSSFLVNNNQRCASNLQPFIEDLKAKLISQPVLHADETGFYFEGVRNWLHTICTEKHSYYAVHVKGGTEAMKDMVYCPTTKADWYMISGNHTISLTAAIAYAMCIT